MSNLIAAWLGRDQTQTGTARGGRFLKVAKKSAFHRLGEIREKLIRQFLGRTVDQALPELGQLAADLRLDIVAQQRAAVLFGQRHRGAALGKTGDPALAFARDLVAVRRVEVAERDLA